MFFLNHNSTSYKTQNLVQICFIIVPSCKSCRVQSAVPSPKKGKACLRKTAQWLRVLCITYLRMDSFFIAKFFWNFWIVYQTCIQGVVWFRKYVIFEFTILISGRINFGSNKKSGCISAILLFCGTAQANLLRIFPNQSGKSPGIKEIFLWWFSAKVFVVLKYTSYRKLTVNILLLTW